MSHLHYPDQSSAQNGLPPLNTDVSPATADPYNQVPASTDGYQDTVARTPMHTAPKLTPHPEHSISPATRLKHKIHHTKDMIVCPGVYDGLSARIAMRVGFETLYMV